MEDREWRIDDHYLLFSIFDPLSSILGFFQVSKPQRPLRQGHAQDRVEQEERTKRKGQGKRYRQYPAALFHDSKEKAQHEQHRDAVAKTFHPKTGKDTDRQYRQSMTPLGPTERR
jgi:hypothetical protein